MFKVKVNHSWQMLLKLLQCRRIHLICGYPDNTKYKTRVHKNCHFMNCQINCQIRLSMLPWNWQITEASTIQTQHKNLHKAIQIYTNTNLCELKTLTFMYTWFLYILTHSSPPPLPIMLVCKAPYYLLLFMMIIIINLVVWGGLSGKGLFFLYAVINALVISPDYTSPEYTGASLHTDAESVSILTLFIPNNSEWVASPGPSNVGAKRSNLGVWPEKKR